MTTMYHLDKTRRRRASWARPLAIGLALGAISAAAASPMQLATRTPAADITQPSAPGAAAPAWTRNAVTLTADGRPFAAQYAAPASTSARGGAILLPGSGGHPDWPEVIGRLRKVLPKDGWAALSIDLPPPTPPGSDPANFVDAVDARLGAAVAFLHKHGVSKIVLIGYDLGASVGAQYLALHPDQPIGAFVDIGMGDTGFGPGLGPGHALSDVHIPVLDVPGAKTASKNDPPNAAAAGRDKGQTAALPSGVKTPGGVRQGKTDQVARIRDWLRQHTAGTRAGERTRTARQEQSRVHK